MTEAGAASGRNRCSGSRSRERPVSAGGKSSLSRQAAAAGGGCSSYGDGGSKVSHRPGQLQLPGAAAAAEGTSSACGSPKAIAASKRALGTSSSTTGSLKQRQQQEPASPTGRGRTLPCIWGGDQDKILSGPGAARHTRPYSAAPGYGSSSSRCGSLSPSRGKTAAAAASRSRTASPPRCRSTGGGRQTGARAGSPDRWSPTVMYYEQLGGKGVGGKQWLVANQLMVAGPSEGAVQELAGKQFKSTTRMWSGRSHDCFASKRLSATQLCSGRTHGRFANYPLPV